MSPVTRTRAFAPVIALTILFLASTPAPARADITAFLGLSPTPARHTVKGFAAGLSLVVVGFEFEFSQLGEDPLDALPGLKTYSGNVFVQTPIEVKGTQFYATAGGSGYRENLAAQILQGDPPAVLIGQRELRRRPDLREALVLAVATLVTPRIHGPDERGRED